MAIEKSTNNISKEEINRKDCIALHQARNVTNISLLQSLLLIAVAKLQFSEAGMKKITGQKLNLKNSIYWLKHMIFYKKLKKGYFKLWPGVKTSLKLEEEEVKAESRIRHWLPMLDRTKIITNDESWKECVMLDCP